VRSLTIVVGIVSALMSAGAGSVHGQSNPQAAEGFVLSGVISFDGGGGLAWLQEPKLTNNEVVAVRRGDSVGPYRLTQIFEDRVELEGPAGKILVPLFGAQAAPVSQAAAASASTPSALASLQQLLRQAGQQRPEGQAPPQEQLQRPQEQAQLPQEQAQLPQEQAQLPQEQAQLPQEQAQLPHHQQLQVLQQLQARQQQLQAPPQQPQTSMEQAAVAQPGTAVTSVPNGLANNPNVLFVPMGDPRRTQGLGALLGLGNR
jgi:flagellar biosynthesis GTPase FlhF